MENTGTVGMDTSVNTEVTGTEGVSDAIDTSTTETSSEGKVESFDEWLKKEEQRVSGKVKKEEKKSDKVTAGPDILDQIKGKGKEELPELEDATKATTEPVKIKIGDKEYGQPEIESMTKELTTATEQYKTQVQENQKMIKDVEAFVNTLRSNPGEILDRFKISQEQVEKYLWDKYYVYKNETPQQKAERLEKQLQERDQKELTQRQQQEEQQRIENNRKYWAPRVQEALTSEGLPENDWTVQRMAGYIHRMQTDGLNLPLVELAKLVKQDYFSAQKELLKNLSPEQVSEALGKETLDKVRSKEVEKFKQNKFQNNSPSQGRIERPEPTNTKRIRDVYHMLDELDKKMK